MKYIKKFENSFDTEVKVEVDKIIKKYDPYVLKYEEEGDFFSVLVKDKNSDFMSYIDLWLEHGDVSSEWNQMSYSTNNSNDMIKKGVENDGDVYTDTFNIALDKLISDEMIYNDDKYYHYKDFWYVKDGYKEQGIGLEDAKRMRKYNL